jgi:hypothetical protein
MGGDSCKSVPGNAGAVLGQSLEDCRTYGVVYQMNQTGMHLAAKCL